VEDRAILNRGTVKKKAPVIRTMIGAARNRIAITVPIPVLIEGKRVVRKNLLTRRTVLGQAHLSNVPREKASAYQVQF